MDDLLSRYVAERNARCPQCGYALRALRSAACPECGTRLDLTLERSRPPMVAWGVLLGVIGLMAGGGSMRLIQEVARGFPSLRWTQSIPVHWALLHFFGLLSPFLFVLVLIARRRIWRWSRAVQWWLVAGVLSVFALEVSMLVLALLDQGRWPGTWTDALFALAVGGVLTFAIFGRRWVGAAVTRGRSASAEDDANGSDAPTS